jgi:hypothetical protein
MAFSEAGLKDVIILPLQGLLMLLFSILKLGLSKVTFSGDLLYRLLKSLVFILHVLGLIL